MEQFKHSQSDPWREAILTERSHPDKRAPMLKEALSQYEGDRNNALILGDACLVQSNILLEKEHFAHVVNVDSSPSLLDDAIVGISDTRLERVLKEFDQYEPPQNTFDLIYGKSIAFNPKETTSQLLWKLADALRQKGLFYAEWAGEGDSYRQGISYSGEELEILYGNAGLIIIGKEVTDKTVKGLLGRPGRVHSIDILATKQ